MLSDSERAALHDMQYHIDLATEFVAGLSYEAFRGDMRWSPGLRQTVKTPLTVRCKFIVPDPGTVLGWACR